MSIMNTYISLRLRSLSVRFMARPSDKVIVSDGHKRDEEQKKQVSS